MEGLNKSIKECTQSFTGNGDYYFTYVEPEHALSIAKEYALDFCIGFQMWAKENDWEISTVGALAIPTFENMRTEQVLEYTELVEAYLKQLEKK